MPDLQTRLPVLGPGSQVTAKVQRKAGDAGPRSTQKIPYQA